MIFPSIINLLIYCFLNVVHLFMYTSICIIILLYSCSDLISISHIVFKISKRNKCRIKLRLVSLKHKLIEKLENNVSSGLCDINYYEVIYCSGLGKIMLINKIQKIILTILR